MYKNTLESINYRLECIFYATKVVDDVGFNHTKRGRGGNLTAKERLKIIAKNIILINI